MSASTIDRSIKELSRLGFISITWKQRTSHYEVAPRTQWSKILKGQIDLSETESCYVKLTSQLGQIDLSDGSVSLYEPDLVNQKEHTPYPQASPSPKLDRKTDDCATAVARGARAPISRKGAASENAAAPDLFQEFIGVFLAAGKKLNKLDNARALKLWRNFNAPEHAAILEHLKRSVVDGTWSDALHTPMPASYLASKAWTRIGPGRVLPHPPQKESKVETAIRRAAERFRQGAR